MAFGKLIADDYSCEDCGSTANSRATDCCDNCLLKFYFDNPNASSFADWQEPNSVEINANLFRFLSQGYEDGVNDVLTALAEFCGQGGSLDAENVVAWVNTYNAQTELYSPQTETKEQE